MRKQHDFKFTGQSIKDLVLKFIADIPVEHGEMCTTMFIDSPSFIVDGKDAVIAQLQALPTVFTVAVRSKGIKVCFMHDDEEQELTVHIWTQDETLAPWLDELEERIRQALIAIGQSGKPVAA